MAKQRKNKSTPAIGEPDELAAPVNNLSKLNGVSDQPDSKFELVNGQLEKDGSIVSPTKANKLLTMETLKKATQDPNEKADSGSSLAVLLTQGLMANDAVKIDTVLRETKLDVINSTLRDIQIGNVIPLLKAIEHRLRNRGALEIRPWIQWINCVLATHMSYLTTQQNLDDELGGLLEWMKSRVGHYQKLLILQGKLGVIAEQIERRTNTTVRPAAQPQIVFNNDDELDSDLDDMESVGSDESGASSEEDWWDEGEKALGMDDDDDDDESDDEDSDNDVLANNRSMEKNQGSEMDDDTDDEDEDDDEEEDMDIG